MNMKRTLALLLTVVMLVSAFPMGIFAAEETELDGATLATDAANASATTDVEDYYFKVDFNKSTIDATGTVMELAAQDSGYDPYGFGTAGNMQDATIVKKSTDDNYVAVEYPVLGGAGGWNGTQFKIGKNGSTESTVFNTTSFEFDFRWRGYTENTGVYNWTKGNIDLLKLHRYDNSPSVFITSREDENGDLALYLKSYSTANYICT